MNTQQQSAEGEIKSYTNSIQILGSMLFTKDKINKIILGFLSVLKSVIHIKYAFACVSRIESLSFPGRCSSHGHGALVTHA